ncbi:hypothetical protein BHE74_00035579, partial [Ensete ventricosum]
PVEPKPPNWTANKKVAGLPTFVVGRRPADSQTDSGGEVVTAPTLAKAKARHEQVPSQDNPGPSALAQKDDKVAPRVGRYLGGGDPPPPQIFFDESMFPSPCSVRSIPELLLGRISSRSDQFPSPCSVGSIPEPRLGHINSQIRNPASSSPELPLVRPVPEPSLGTSPTSPQAGDSAQDLIFNTLIRHLEKVFPGGGGGGKNDMANVDLMLTWPPRPRDLGQLARRRGRPDAGSRSDAADTKEFVISTSSWSPKRRTGSLAETRTEYSVAAEAKPLVSTRFGHPKATKPSADGRLSLSHPALLLPSSQTLPEPSGGKTVISGKALGVARRNETLESTWRTVTERRARPLKKSDTWNTRGGICQEKPAAGMRKSETLNERAAAASRGRPRREASAGRGVHPEV